MAITRTEAASLFTEQFSADVIQEVKQSSVALATIPSFPMSDKVYRVPVLTALPTAGFLAAEGDSKPETGADWDDVTVTAEEIAAIVPIDDSVLADAKIDVAAEVKALLTQEFARIIDAGVFFGTNVPASWPTGGIFGYVAAGNKVTYADGSSFGEAFDKVEDLGADVTNVWAGRNAKSLLRNPKDADGDRVDEVGVDSIYGAPVSYPLGWNKASAYTIQGDRTKAILGIRQDMTFSVSNEATLDTYGSLWQKDATAIRAVMRIGFNLANPYYMEAGAQAYPFSAVIPAPAAASSKK